MISVETIKAIHVDVKRRHAIEDEILMHTLAIRELREERLQLSNKCIAGRHKVSSSELFYQLKGRL